MYLYLYYLKNENHFKDIYFFSFLCKYENDQADKCPSHEMSPISDKLPHCTQEASCPSLIVIIVILSLDHMTSGWTWHSIENVTHLKKTQLFPLSHHESQIGRWSGSNVDDISHRFIQASTCTKSGIKLIFRLRFNRSLCNKANTHCSQDVSSTVGDHYSTYLSQSAGVVVHLHQKGCTHGCNENVL